MGFPPVMLLLPLFLFSLPSKHWADSASPEPGLASCALSLLLLWHCSVTGNVHRGSSHRTPSFSFARGVAFLCVKQIYVPILAESFSWKPFFCKNWFSPDITFLLYFCCLFFCENWSWMFSCTSHYFFSTEVQKVFSCCPSLHLPHISLCCLIN